MAKKGGTKARLEARDRERAIENAKKQAEEARRAKEMALANAALVKQLVDIVNENRELFSGGKRAFLLELLEKKLAEYQAIIVRSENPLGFIVRTDLVKVQKVSKALLITALKGASRPTRPVDPPPKKKRQ